jgi:MFS family permease
LDEPVQNRWTPLCVLGAAQFLMVLDTAVMNVSITALVEDLDTEVTSIQAAITTYALVMAAFMVLGGRLGAIHGVRRVFLIGMVIYGIGSAITAMAPDVPVLIAGWSFTEGFGAALVLPALAALIAGIYQGRDRAVAYAVIGGLAGVGVAVGPLIGGWVTTNLTWRLVFAGEVAVVLAILASSRALPALPVRGSRDLDVVGAALSAAGLAMVVLAVLQSTTWGWLQPKQSPVEPFGFSLTLFVLGGGAVVLSVFARWQRRREAVGREPLVHLDVLRLPRLRAGLSMILAQNVILLGVFFTVPLYLQVVQGLDAFETGVRIFPVSVTMLLAALSGPVLGRFASPRTIVRWGLAILFAGILALLAVVEPALDNTSFALSMAVLGTGMGLLASQLANVVQSSVGEAGRSEAGGLQYTAQNLGAAVGTALMGSIVLGALSASFLTTVAEDPRIAATVRAEVVIQLEPAVPFVPLAEVEAALRESPVSPPEQAALLDDYADAQLRGLKAALLAGAGIALASFWLTRSLPAQRLLAPPRRRAGTATGGPGKGPADRRGTDRPAARPPEAAAPGP